MNEDLQLEEIIRVIPAAGGPGDDVIFRDLRIDARDFHATLCRVVPAGVHRTNALRQLRNCLISSVLGVTMSRQVGPRRETEVEP